MTIHGMLSKAISKPNQTSSTTKTKEDRASAELESYFLQPTVDEPELDLLSWWRGRQAELPILQQVVVNVLTTNATSVASERLFSVAGNIVSDKRSCLKPDIVSKVCSLAFNRL